ncbi:outer membrane protein assembly factor BamB family protein [Inquilinus sp. CA228]|uniref:outer membrane protein assembly factor BamB family protein n=1 Tax=Inquilinus sp. CA228 TaxID=3455609 RepID=UPI003F8D7D66
MRGGRMKPTPLWTARLGKERRVRARAPVFAGDVVYQVFHYDKGGFFESVMLALDAGTGAERWRTTIGHVANESVVGPDGTVYLSSFEGSIRAYDRTGQVLWGAPEAECNIGIPSLAGDGRLVVAEIHGGGRRTWCLDARSGAVLWTFHNGGHSYAIAATTETVVHATVVAGAKFGESTIHLFALSAENGRRLWSATHDQYLFMPRIVDDLVVVGARGALLAYSRSDGRPVARLDLPPPAVAKALTPLADGFLLSDDTPLAAADDAPAIRRVALRRKRSLFRSAVELAPLWTAPLPQGMVGRPVDLGAVAAVLLEGGDLHILNLGDGRQVALHKRSGEDSGAGGIACSGPLLAVANGRTLEVYRQSDLIAR